MNRKGQTAVLTGKFMTSQKGKIVIVIILFLLGIAMLTYGAFFHSTNISPQQTDDSAQFARSEGALIKEVSVGGVKRDESGEIKQTYTGQAPQACPT
jgi:hypothetical protein